MQEYYSQIQAAGGSLIAISVDSVNTTKRTVQDLGLTFTVLSDSGKSAISAYNVVDQGQTSIARPATYIIKKDGTVGWTSIDPTHSRVSTSTTLSELEKLK